MSLLLRTMAVNIYLSVCRKLKGNKSLNILILLHCKGKNEFILHWIYRLNDFLNVTLKFEHKKHFEGWKPKRSKCI